MLQNRYNGVSVRRIGPKLAFRLTVLLALILGIALSALAQASPTPSPSPSPKMVPAEEKSGAPVAKPTLTPVINPGLKRWFDFDALNVSTRYRYIEANNGTTLNNQQQYQYAVRGHFNFDRKARYRVYAGLFTGNSITGGWNNTGWGTGDWQSEPYVKQLYFDAKPVKPIEIQYGGIQPNNGENTEITGYDNDVYLTGERVVFRSPKHVYFDEVSVTYAYFGDNNDPNVFHRFKHLDDSNYHQFLVRKQVNKHIGFSADYTFENGLDTLREAVRFKIPETHILDNVLFENYQRVSPNHGYGFNAEGEKTFKKKLTVMAGFAHIDVLMFNADRFPRGNRAYLSGTYKFNREFSINSIIIQGIGRLQNATTPRTRFEIIFTYNILETLHRYKVL